GIVYRTDAAISKGVRIAMTVQSGPEVVYSVARVKASAKADSQKFIDFLSGPEGRAVFQRYGFVVRAPSN
ncbi:MAG TPA: substrate-binding domain-containing protein, partial [Thermoanaerobaculia bacterium]